MTIELALVWLCITGSVLAALADNWTERQRMTTIFVLLIILMLTLLAMK